jgi:hypothetical protein
MLNTLLPVQNPVILGYSAHPVIVVQAWWSVLRIPDAYPFLHSENVCGCKFQGWDIFPEWKSWGKA